MDKEKFKIHYGQGSLKPGFYLDCGDTQLYTTTTFHQTRHFKWVNFILCKLYLTKSGEINALQDHIPPHTYGVKAQGARS